MAGSHPQFSIIEQCALLKVPRSTLYYKPKPVSDEELKLMRRIDEIFTKWPFYGSRRLVEELRGEGYSVNRERVRRLMKLMGIEAIYQKPNTSRKHPHHKIYPYLLKNLAIDRPNQVWCADITYIPMAKGWVYLVPDAPTDAPLTRPEPTRSNPADFRHLKILRVSFLHKNPSQISTQAFFRIIAESGYTLTDRRVVYMLPNLITHHFDGIQRSRLSREISHLAERHFLRSIIVPEGTSYDEYVMRHTDKISELVDHNWRTVARQSSDILLEIIPIIDQLLARWIECSDVLLLRSIFIQKDLPPTPRRTGPSVHSIVHIESSFVADYVMHALAFRMKKTGGFTQSNINFVDDHNVIHPLYAHFDRGTEYTFLSCIKHSVPQTTLFSLWNFFFDKPEDALRTLDHEGSCVFEISGGRIRLAERMIRREHNWQDIATLCYDTTSYAHGEREFNRCVDLEIKSPHILGIELQEGDILLFKNSSLVHGRTRGLVSSTRQVPRTENVDSRWLRAMFI